MKPKVIWTAREWNSVAQRLVDSGVDPDRHGWRGELVEAMKAMLPKDRWRDTANLSTAKDILKPLMKELAQRGSAAPGPVIATPPEPPKPTAEALSTEDLLVELARRVARMLEPEPRVESANPPPVDRGFHPKHDPEPSTSTRIKKPRILILGPKGHQQEILRKRFSILDLRFVTCEDNPNRCAAGIIDEAILWTKFMNHAQQETVKTLGYQTWFANSMGEIEARLEKWG